MPANFPTGTNTMMRPWLILLCLAAVVASPVAAQDKKDGKGSAKEAQADKKPAATVDKKPAATADTDEPADETASDPAVVEYDKVFGEWKDLLAKLQNLRTRYVTTPRKGNLREPIKKEYDELVKEGEKLEPKVIQAAEAAFTAVGNKKPEIGKFLASQLKYKVEHDDYESAVPIARALIENGFDNPRVYNLGGIAAFCTNDLEDAENWLKQGDKQSVLEDDARSFLTHIKQYKELWKTEQELREAEAKADDLPRVLLKTTRGDIVVELFENEAPNTVANFVHLVEEGFYNGVKFHRVLPHFMAQGGDPKGDGTGGPGYTIPDETDRTGYRNHFRGSLSMANTGQPDTGGSQFFLMFRPSGPAAGYNLNGKHTVFGRVIEGLDVLAQIQRIDPEKPEPGEKPDKIVEATVLRKREHDYVPKKAGDKSEETDEKKEKE